MSYQEKIPFESIEYRNKDKMINNFPKRQTYFDKYT